jgi:hypothetical protein
MPLYEKAESSSQWEATGAGIGPAGRGDCEIDICGSYHATAGSTKMVDLITGTRTCDDAVCPSEPTARFTEEVTGA